MASKTTLLTTSVSTTWNGSSFDSTQTVNVPANTDFLCIRIRTNFSWPPTLEHNGTPITQVIGVFDGDANWSGIGYFSAPAEGSFDIYFNSGGTISRTYTIIVDAISGSSGLGDSKSSGGFKTSPSSLTMVNGVGDLILDAVASPLTDLASGSGQNDDFLTTGNLSGSNKVATSENESMSWTHTDGRVAHTAVVWTAGSTTPEVRKSSTFDIETTLGTITTATLNSVNVFDHITGQAGTTVSFAGAATDEITTSGEYTLTLGDGTGTEDITVQVNVVGVAPSNNPLQKDGSALASLTGVQVRVTDGGDLNGTQLEYLPTATTDASGNLGNIDLSSTAAAVDDSVLLHMRTAAGDSIISDETVELI